MKALKICASVLLCSQLSGCFFVFIPGSVVSKVGDAITGAEGEHCVGRGAVVGSKILGTEGKVYEVKSLSGTSSRCTDPNLPIRAAVALVSST